MAAERNPRATIESRKGLLNAISEQVRWLINVASTSFSGAVQCTKSHTTVSVLLTPSLDARRSLRSHIRAMVNYIFLLHFTFTWLQILTYRRECDYIVTRSVPWRVSSRTPSVKLHRGRSRYTLHIDFFRGVNNDGTICGVYAPSPMEDKANFEK